MLYSGVTLNMLDMNGNRAVDSFPVVFYVHTPERVNCILNENATVQTSRVSPRKLARARPTTCTWKNTLFVLLADIKRHLPCGCRIMKMDFNSEVSNEIF